MDAQRKIARLIFLEYLKRREPKRRPSAEGDDAVKRDNLLAHRFVIMETVESVLRVLTAPYAVIGGHAVTFHGRPRMTDDVDILVSPQRCADGGNAARSSASVAAEDRRLRRRDAGRHAHRRGRS